MQRKITNKGKIVTLEGSDNLDGSKPFIIMAKEDFPGTIFVDFSPKGGPPNLLGVFDETANAIKVFHNIVRLSLNLTATINLFLVQFLHLMYELHSINSENSGQMATHGRNLIRRFSTKNTAISGMTDICFNVKEHSPFVLIYNVDLKLIKSNSSFNQTTTIVHSFSSSKIHSHCQGFLNPVNKLILMKISAQHRQAPSPSFLLYVCPFF